MASPHKIKQAHTGERWFRIEVLEKVPGSSFPKAHRFEGNAQNAQVFLRALAEQVGG